METSSGPINLEVIETHHTSEWLSKHFPTKSNGPIFAPSDSVFAIYTIAKKFDESRLGACLLPAPAAYPYRCVGGANRRTDAQPSSSPHNRPKSINCTPHETILLLLRRNK